MASPSLQSKSRRGRVTSRRELLARNIEKGLASLHRPFCLETGSVFPLCRPRGNCKSLPRIKRVPFLPRLGRFLSLSACFLILGHKHARLATCSLPALSSLVSPPSPPPVPAACRVVTANMKLTPAFAAVAGILASVAVAVPSPSSSSLSTRDLAEDKVTFGNLVSNITSKFNSQLQAKKKGCSCTADKVVYRRE